MFGWFLSKKGSFRVLAEGEWDLLLRHARRLDDRAIISRFGSDMSDAELVRWARTTSFNDVIGWFVRGELRGSVEIGYRGERAECGITVEPEYQNRRIGRQLFDRACRLAKGKGAKEMVMLARRRQERDIRLISQRPGWSFSACYCRSIILPNPEPEHPLWLIRDLSRTSFVGVSSRGLRIGTAVEID
ncbi:MAG: GNAT family N-acetyltransferase [Pseudomonadota bacterium]